MSWSSSGGASKSSRLRAATGATNVRKPNPAARTGRFSPGPQTDGELDNLFSVWFSPATRQPPSFPPLFLFCFPLFAFFFLQIPVSRLPILLWFTFANFTLSRTEAFRIRIPPSETWKSLRKIRRMVARKHLVTPPLFFPLRLSACLAVFPPLSLPALSFSSQPGGLHSAKVYFLQC